MDNDKVRIDTEEGNKILYVLLNVIWMAAMLFKKTTLIGYVIGVLGTIIASASLYIGKKNEEASGKCESAVVWMVFWDIITIYAAKLYPSIAVLKLENLKYVLKDLNGYFFGFLIVGIVFWITGKNKRNFKIQYIGVEFWLFWIVMLRASMQISSMTLIRLAYFISASVLFGLWFLLLQGIDAVNREFPQYKGLQIATILLLLFYFLKVYLTRPLLEGYFASYSVRLEQHFSHTFGFWPVTIFFVLLLIASIVSGLMEESSTKRCGCNAVLFMVAGCVLVLMKALKDLYFPGNYLVFIFFGNFFAKEMKAESEGLEREWNGRWRLLLETVCLCIAMALIAIGYWTLMVLGAALYGLYCWLKKKGKMWDAYYYFLAALFAEIVFFSLTMKVNADYIRLAAVIILVLAGMMRCISWPHPSLKRDRSDLKKCICLMAFALSLVWILADKNKNIVQVSYDGIENQATITLDKDTDIEEGYYYWSDMFGRNRSGQGSLGTITNKKDYKYTENVQGSTLHIITVDQNGTKRRRTYHFPLIFYGRE